MELCLKAEEPHQEQQDQRHDRRKRQRFGAAHSIVEEQEHVLRLWLGIAPPPASKAGRLDYLRSLRASTWMSRSFFLRPSRPARPSRPKRPQGKSLSSSCSRTVTWSP